MKSINSTKIALIGYLIITMINGSLLLHSDTTKQLFLFGNILVFVGYLLLSKEYYEELNKDHKKKSEEFSKGHLILFILYLGNYFMPINPSPHNFDLIILASHLLLIKHNEYSYIGYIGSFIYYSLLIHHYSSEEGSTMNYIKMFAYLLLVYYNYTHIKL